MLEGAATTRKDGFTGCSAVGPSAGQLLCWAVLAAGSMPLATQAQDVSTVGQGAGIFGQVPVCQPLMNIIGDSMNSTERWGRFTEPVTAELLQQCVTGGSSLNIPDGLALRNAIREFIPAPEIKVMQTVPEPAVQLPNVRWQIPDFFRPGSVNILDCQNNWLDLTHLAVADPLVEAVVVYWRCHLAQTANHQGAATQAWVIDSWSHGPCQDTVPGSTESPTDPTEDNPQHVEEAHPHVGPAHYHTINWTRWCYTDEDYNRIFMMTETETEEGGDNGNKSRTPVIIGAVVLSMVGVLGVLIYVFTPRCVKFFYKPSEASATERSMERNDTEAQAQTPDWKRHNREYALWWPATRDNSSEQGPRHPSSDVPQRRMRAVAMSDGGHTTGLLNVPSAQVAAVSDDQKRDNPSGGVSGWLNPYVNDKSDHFVKTQESHRSNTYTPVDVDTVVADSRGGAMHMHPGGQHALHGVDAGGSDHLEDLEMGGWPAGNSAALQHEQGVLIDGFSRENGTASFMSANSQIETPTSAYYTPTKRAEQNWLSY